MTDSTPTFRLLITSFTDFLTAAIHTVLYERQIYPQTSFLSARKYNFPVRQSRHPKVCEWVNDAVAAVEAELLKATVDQVAVMIYDSANKPQERFVFDVSRFPIIPDSELDTTLERVDEDGEKTDILPIVDMEEQFRATMSKLAGCSSMLNPLPKGCTFTIVIHLKDGGEAPVTHPQPWMPVQPRNLKGDSDPQALTTKPVRAVSAGDMVFETWIEQVEKKKDDG
jgi:mitotic spindle assembly checkpoint protein MAD2B